MDRRTFIRSGVAAGSVAAFGWPLAGCVPAPRVTDPLGPDARGLPTPTPGRDQWARMPSAFTRRVTAETPTSPLEVLEGSLPPDLAGHVFFQSLSLLDSDAGFSGDSLIWRVDFDGPSPRITSRILRTTDYLMAQAFAGTNYAFQSRGMMRLGLLGIQNQSNTALVPLDGNRLIATVDGGRPWEIDPASLRPITPVGRLDDYRPMMEFTDFDRFVCPYTVTTAHPPYDRRTGEYYGVSLSIVPVPGMIYCEMVVWDGRSDMKRVPILTPDLSPLLISQSAHQICVSRDYVVIIDSSSTIEAGKLLNPPTSLEAGKVQTPRPDSWCYIIDRNELRMTTGAAIAHKAVIPRETGHFFVDYDHPAGRVVIHDAHTAALDFAEWTMPYDTHPFTGQPIRSDLVSAATPVSYDLGVVGRYEIDVLSGSVIDQHAFTNDWTWGTGGLSARNPLTSDDTLGELFHSNSGFPTDLAVDRVYQGFKGYPHRLVSNEELPWSGVPTSLVRINHDAGKVVDGFFFAGDRFAWTPTFVPRHGTATGSADGYILSVVYSDHATPQSAGTELWVFDAARLGDGPVAKLGRRDLAMPMTLHSCWLDSLVTSRPDYHVDVAAELVGRAHTWYLDPDVEGIIRSEVLPAWESSRA